MTATAISVENLSKSYRLGAIGTGTFYGDLKRWWAMQRGKPDPYLRIGESDNGSRAGETIWALQDINFIVKQGEALGIIGSNGAGKSTLLKILSQVTAPTSGVVNVKGRIASLLEVGTGFHPELTGRENIFMNGAILGMSHNEIIRKFDEIVDFSGVEKHIDTPVKRYSSGMYVRLAFAVAAHLDPEILIIDEVLAVGDAQFQKKCLGKMGEVASEGRTVLFVSHNMTSVEMLCHNAILVERGTISFRGPVHETIEYYLEQHENDGLKSYAEISSLEEKHKVLKSISLMNEENEQAAVFKVGEKIIFKLLFDSGEVILNSPRILISVSNRKHGSICYFSTDQMVNHPFKVDSKTVIKCIWEGCYLIPGLYSVGVKVAGINMERANAVLQFEVLERDNFGTGKEVAGDLNTIFIPNGHWRFS